MALEAGNQHVLRSRNDMRTPLQGTGRQEDNSFCHNQAEESFC